MAELSGIRRTLVQLANDHIGCGVGVDREQYLQLVAGPGDTDEAIQKALCTMSGCALTVRGLWRLAGLDHPKLRNRYEIGHAMEDLQSIAREAGGWVQARSRRGALPQPGDAVILESQTGGHAFTVLEISPLPGRLAELVTVDGGQKDSEGRQKISRFRRHWSQDGADVHDHACITRRVAGWIDVDCLGWPGQKQCC